MARVLVTFRVFPESVDVELRELKNRIEKSLPKDCEVYGANEEPIAFGLKALLLRIAIPEEKEGEMDRVEKALKTVQGVSEVQVISVSRAR